jgi:hypothetical protein
MHGRNLPVRVPPKRHHWAGLANPDEKASGPFSGGDAQVSYWQFRSGFSAFCSPPLSARRAAWRANVSLFAYLLA